MDGKAKNTTLLLPIVLEIDNHTLNPEICQSMSVKNCMGYFVTLDIY